MQRVDAVTLATDNPGVRVALSDGTYGYFGTSTRPGQVVKVNLATMKRVDTVTLNTGEDWFGASASAVTDGTFVPAFEWRRARRVQEP